MSMLLMGERGQSHGDACSTPALPALSWWAASKCLQETDAPSPIGSVETVVLQAGAATVELRQTESPL